MRRVLCTIAMQVVLLICARAQPPAITQNGVSNLASQIVSTLAGGALARGALIEIRGVRLAAVNETTSVFIIREGSRIPVNVVSATASNVAARIPENAPLGAAKLVVSVKGQQSAAFPIDIAETNVGLFSENSLGWGQAKADNLLSSGKTVANSATSPVRPSQRITFTGTGVAPKTALKVSLGGIAAVANWQRTVREGEEEFAMTIPPNTKEGCSVPLYALAAPRRASNVVTVAVGKTSPCVRTMDSPPGITRKMIAIFSHTSMKAARAPVESIYDEAIVSFVRLGPDARPLSLTLLPPPGTCTAYWGSFQTTTEMLPDSISALLISDAGGIGLDAGPSLTLTHDGIARQIPSRASDPGFFRARVGSRDVEFGPRALPPYLEPGSFKIDVPGGRDIGAFSAKFEMPQTLEWLNRSATDTVDRSRDLTVEWRAAAPDRVVVVMLSNVGESSTATGTVVCSAEPKSGKLSIPAAILANLPASAGEQGPYNRMFVGTLPAKAQRVEVPGLQIGLIVNLLVVGRFVQYR